MTTLEHLDRCPVCLRRTLHRRTVQLDESGRVVSESRTCLVCAGAGTDPATNPVLVMKEARALKRKLRPQPYKRRTTPAS